jgi:hypothetical protein
MIVTIAARKKTTCLAEIGLTIDSTHGKGKWLQWVAELNDSLKAAV